MTKLIFFIILSLSFVSCRTLKKENNNTVSETSLKDLEIENKDFKTADKQLNIPFERPVYRETETVFTDLIHTKLEVNFDWSKSRMNGIATITAKPHFYTSDSLILDAKGMEIQKVVLNDKPLLYTYSNDLLKIKLDKKYKRTENYTVQITYVSKPDERELAGSKAISSDKGLYFINPKGEDKTKMPQIWTQGETESNSVWFPTIDSPNSKSTEEIFITVDSKYTTLSNGKLSSSKVNSDGTRTDHWKQDLAHAPYLFMMGVGEFKIVKDFYTRPDGTKMEVNYYVEPQWENSAKAIFGETPNMIKYFSELLGVEYPWDKYSQIVVRDYVSGAMENTGAVVFGDYAYKTERELLDENDQSTIAHELFHHWFGDLVTAESWSNLTVNESFANYSQYLWDERRFGLDEAEYQAEIEAEGYFQSAQSGGYHDLVWFEYNDKEEMFDGHSYNKGGRILHMLRCYLGDEAFFKGINLYLTTNKFKAAEFHQLRLAFEEVSGQDLNWFFNQWYLSSGHPILDIKQVNNPIEKKVSISINQSQNINLFPVFKLPIQIAVFDSLGKHIHEVIIDELTDKFEIQYSGTLKCVIVDDQQMLLAKIREEKPLDQYVFQYYHGNKYISRKTGLLEGTSSKNLHPEELILNALKDPFWDIRLIAIDLASKLEDENKLKCVETMKILALTDSNSAVRSNAIQFLSKNLDQKEVDSFLVDRLENDQSYLVISSALGALGSKNPKLALERAKSLENESSSSLLFRIGKIYSGFGTFEEYSFFEKTLKGTILKGYDQVGMLNSFTLFIAKQEIDLNEKAFDIFSYLKLNGDYYTKMFLGKNITYLQNSYSDKIKILTEEIDLHEKNKDVVYANQGRQKIKQYEALIIKFGTLIEIEK